MALSNKPTHEHSYVAEKYKVQTMNSQYVSSTKGYQRTILESEKVVLFCTKCGHKIEPESEATNE